MGGVVKEIVARAKAEAEAEAKAEAEAEAVSKFLAEEQEPEINMDDL